jgi:hypothetical protein
MPVNWNRGLNKALRVMGQPWTTTNVDGNPITFNGIFNTVSGYEEINGVTTKTIIVVTTLTVRTDIAKDFVFNQAISDHCGKVWHATQKIMQDDGLVMEVKLVEAPE